MAPPAMPSHTNVPAQTLARSNIQDCHPGWLLAQPVTIQNQRVSPLIPAPDVLDQREAIQSNIENKQQARPYFPAPASRRPRNPQPDNEVYAWGVQEQLYNTGADTTPSLQTSPPFTARPSRKLRYSRDDVELAVNPQSELYTVHEPHAQRGFPTLSGGNNARPKHQASSWEQGMAFEGENRNVFKEDQSYSVSQPNPSRQQEALRRPAHATTFGHRHEYTSSEPSRQEDSHRMPSYASSLGHEQICRLDFPNDRRPISKRPLRDSQDLENENATTTYYSRQDQTPDVREGTQRGRNGALRGTQERANRRSQRPQTQHAATEIRPAYYQTQSYSPNEEGVNQVSKRARRAAQILEERGPDTEIGADNHPKGLVRFARFRNSQVQWRNNEEDDWKPAVYHHQLRQKYIRQQHPLDRFDIARAKGNDRYDITTYLGLWRHWRPTRKDGWQGIQADVLYSFERAGYPVPDYRPGFLMDEGRIVLDLDNHPVKNWWELPICLSSQLDGSDIETVRRINPGITLLDIRARMPRETLTGPKKDKVTPLFGPTALGNRTTRFRERNSCPSWLERTGSDRLKDFVWSLMSHEQRNVNSTRGLEMLTELQLAEFKDQTKGKFLERAGTRALPEEERRKRHAADAEKLSKLRQTAGSRQERASHQRKRTYAISLDTEDEDEVQFLGIKRRKTPRNMSSVEQRADDELKSLFPSRQAEAILDVLVPSYSPQHQSLPRNSRKSNLRKRSRFEDDPDNDAFLPDQKRHRHGQSSYELKDPFIDSAFANSSCRPPISYPAISGIQSSPTTNVRRVTTAVGHRPPTTFRNEFHSPLTSFPAGCNNVSDTNRGLNNRKRRYSNTRDSADELFDQEPKRREPVQWTRLPNDPFADQEVEASSPGPLFPHRKAHQYPGVTRSQGRSSTLQSIVENSPASYATSQRQYSACEGRLTLSNSDQIIRDNAHFPNNEKSIVRNNARSQNAKRVMDALFFGDDESPPSENLHPADAALELHTSARHTSENGPRLRTLSPSPVEITSAQNQPESNYQQHRTSEKNIAGDSLQAASDFQIREDTPETYLEDGVSLGNVGFENVMEDEPDNEKENQAPSSQPLQSHEHPTPEVEIRQNDLISLDDVQLVNIVSGSDLEASILGNFFDFGAAASGEPPSLDYRFVDPLSEIDQQLIQVALWYTMAELSWWTQGITVATTRRHSYQSQYEEIQAEFAKLWLVDAPVPQLVRVGPWFGSFENHPLPDIPIERFNDLLNALPEDAPPWYHPGDL